MAAYYNEIDPYAAQWLRNLIQAGQIAPGDVDERSIVDVRPDELRGYTQAHFFAGIGGWSIALRLAGWDDSRPVWTGSCPCQPFSAAGAGKAGDDERHLWPAWFPLIAKCRPATVFGEQVEAAVGWGWLDAVFTDLESEGYACGATVLPACGIGAPHIRNRLWFIGALDEPQRERDGRIPGSQGRAERATPGGWQEEGGRLLQDFDTGATRSVADANGGDASAEGLQRSRQHGQRSEGGGTDELGNAAGGGQREFGDALEPRRSGHPDGTGVLNGFWADAEWIACTDGRARPVGPGSFPLGHGIQRRASKLRAYGNAIVPQVAAEFIRAAS